MKKVRDMSEHENGTASVAEFVGPDTGASVDKIRDILFGTQIKNYEHDLPASKRTWSARRWS